MEEIMPNLRLPIIGFEMPVTDMILEVQEVQSKDLVKQLGNVGDSRRSQIIKSLVEKKMLLQTPYNRFKYVLNFSNNYLLRSILTMLDANGFLPTN